MTTTSEGWATNPPCRGKWDLFFPEVDEDGIEVGPTDEARSICATCPFQTECLDYAIRTKQTYGIAGGLDYKQRESLRMSTYRQMRKIDLQAVAGELVG